MSLRYRFKWTLHDVYAEPSNGMESPMKTVLVTTTIHVPQVLSRYRELGPEIHFIVIGDRKTPHADVVSFLETVGNATYYSDVDQSRLGYRCSDLIGWNKIMRRNIGILEAIKLQPDLIVSIDDDNLPMGKGYFSEFEAIFAEPYNGIMATADSGWFNIGDYLSDQVYHRGFSFEQREKTLNCRLLPIQGKKVGIAAGLWLGDPDIDAVVRLVNKPSVLHFSELLSHGLLVDKNVFAPVNSQNTAYVLELAPLMMVLVDVGRYDDIWASYIAERVMMDTEYHVHYGKPYVWQERNPQNLWRNLRDEIYGMEFTPRFCSDLLAMKLPEGSVLDKLESLYDQLAGKEYLPPLVCELGKAWCSDVKSVL